MDIKNRKVKVVNRTEGALAYKIDSLGVVRYWRSTGDHLNIAVSELLELKTVQGGNTILSDYVVIEDEDALNLIFSDQEIEPEYNYGVKEIKHLLYEGETAQLLDALDFAPKGVLDLIRAESVKQLPNEMSKINAINEKFDTDISKAHEIAKERDVKPEKKVAKPKRRTVPIAEVEETKLPKYNVVKRED